jgi:hypothetical protein
MSPRWEARAPTRSDALLMIPAASTSTSAYQPESVRISAARSPFSVLQHLCYILLQYETTISQLFPPLRRGQDHKRSDWINSNLMGIRKTRHVCECYTDTFSEERRWKME